MPTSPEQRKAPHPALLFSFGELAILKTFPKSQQDAIVADRWGKIQSGTFTEDPPGTPSPENGQNTPSAGTV